jgi:rhodanese-related sulfurtransferase
MNENQNPNPASVSDRKTEAKQVILEALLVAAIGAAVAFAANAVSPRGLALTRNYFPGATNSMAAAPVLPQVAGIKQKGLQWVDEKTALRLYDDPGFQQQLIVFIDARDEEQYQAGHIPGAYEFNPYYPERYLLTVLPVCQVAEKIVVYCQGGDCEDSQFAAVTLRDAGIQNQKLSVLIGGMTEWMTNGWPVETGKRNSGNVHQTAR